jgi:hypothetical protein
MSTQPDAPVFRKFTDGSGLEFEVPTSDIEFLKRALDEHMGGEDFLGSDIPGEEFARYVDLEIGTLFYALDDRVGIKIRNNPDLILALAISTVLYQRIGYDVAASPETRERIAAWIVNIGLSGAHDEDNQILEKVETEVLAIKVKTCIDTHLIDLPMMRIIREGRIKEGLPATIDWRGSFTSEQES